MDGRVEGDGGWVKGWRRDWKRYMIGRGRDMEGCGGVVGKVDGWRNRGGKVNHGARKGRA